VLYKAVSQGAVVGCVCLTHEPGTPRAHFGLLAISGRQKGLGKIVVEYVENVAKQAGATEMELSVVNIRPGWLSEWYRRLGYEDAGTERFPDMKRVKPEYHGSIGFVLMRKRLT